MPAVAASTLVERDVTFTPGAAFYRAESCQARDLAVLAAALHRQSHGRLRVLDALAGCGIRSKRYLLQAGADMVWANDYSPNMHNTIVANLMGTHGSGTLSTSRLLAGLKHDVLEFELTPPPGTEMAAQCRVSHMDASRVLASCNLREDYYDLVDCDAFGSTTAAALIGPALSATAHGGMVYLTATDGIAASGRDAARTLAAYGAHATPVPFSNEIGLRLLVGCAVREAASRGLQVAPLFCLYAPHGPVFRALLRVTRGRTFPHRRYRFLAHCRGTGDSWPLDWGDLGRASAKLQADSAAAAGVDVIGPLWTGALHDRDFLAALAAEAARRGWSGTGVDAALFQSRRASAQPAALEQLLAVLVEEAQPELPPGYVLLDDVCRHGRLVGPPPRDKLLAELRTRGLTAARCHLEPRAVRSTASMAQLVEAAVTGLHIVRR